MTDYDFNHPIFIGLRDVRSSIRSPNDLYGSASNRADNLDADTIRGGTIAYFSSEGFCVLPNDEPAKCRRISPMSKEAIISIIEAGIKENIITEKDVVLTFSKARKNHG